MDRTVSITQKLADNNAYVTCCTVYLDWAIGTVRWSLKVCGIWRDENNSQCRNAVSKLLLPLYTLIILVFFTSTQTYTLFIIWGNLMVMIDLLITYVPISVALCKMVTMWYKQEAIAIMMNIIKEDWAKRKSEQEREVMIKYAQASRILTYSSYGVISASLLVYHPSVLLGSFVRTLNNMTDPADRHLSLPTVFLFDVYETPFYEMTYCCQVLCCSIGAFCYTTTSNLFGAIVLHMGSQLKNLSVKLEQVVENDQKNHINFQKFFTSNVKEHQRLIRFADMIESTFSIMLLMVVPAFMLTFCLQGFQLISTIGDDAELPKTKVAFCATYMAFSACVMFVYSMVGQVLTTQSENLQYAAYNCDWFNLRSKEAAQMIIIIIRAQRPFQITAGKFVPLNMGTFASLLKTTAGYLSCLLAVQD